MEEKLSAVTHGVGAVFALLGFVVLTSLAYLHGGLWHILSSIIYGSSLFILYLASTLYHSFNDDKHKHFFRIIDHAAIYLLIAGTYTPFTLILLHGTIGWSIFVIIWFLAIIGIILKVFYVQRFKILSTICYIIMGWLMLFCLKPLFIALPVSGLLWLVAGGLFYTVGTVFYIYRWFPYNHAVWHLFVLAGSIAHFITILYYVLPVQIVS